MSDTPPHSAVDTIKEDVDHMGEPSDEKCDMQLATKFWECIANSTVFCIVWCGILSIVLCYNQLLLTTYFATNFEE